MTNKSSTPNGSDTPAPADQAAWIPDTPGQSIEGEVTEVTRAWSDARTNGGKNMERGWYVLLRLWTTEGVERDVHCFRAVLESRILDYQPVPGERLRITYLGTSDKEPPKGQSAPVLYRVEMPGRDPSIAARNVYAAMGAAPRASERSPGPAPAPDTEPLSF